MEIVYFTAAAVLLYFLSDRILEVIEHKRGARFENRSVIFFGILVGSALIVFRLIRLVTGTG